jgi:hypothetical protein
VKRSIAEALNIVQLETTLRDKSLMWYMKYKVAIPVGNTRSLMYIKRGMLREFQKPKS